MGTISENIENIKSQLIDNVKLVAVSKFKPCSDILEAYQSGQRLFGENYVQELTEKYEQLPKDISWHYIGHLQRNKVKNIISFVSCIQGIDSERLLLEVNNQAAKHNRVVDCLLQFHIAQETEKFGFTIEEAIQMLNGETFQTMKNVRICGVMGMATFTNKKDVIRAEFQCLKKYFDQLKQSYFKNESSFKEISMGMTDDFKIAMEEGSTMVRIGSAIFGQRVYNK